MAVTIMSGSGNDNTQLDVTKYALMLGGLNTTHDLLSQWDPYIGGYYRVFMVRKPTMMMKYMGKRFNNFKHILEYGNLGYSGINDPTINFSQLQGGYNNKQIEMPTGVEDGTTEFTLKVFELNGGLIREVLHTWVNNVIDFDSGLAHYGGLISRGTLGYRQANHTCEFIVANTDRTGMKLQYAVHLTNCFPKNVPTSHYNADPGQHEFAQYDVTFTCNARYGLDVNRKALILLKNFQIMTNSLEAATMLDENNGMLSAAQAKGYNPATGKLETINDYTKVGELGYIKALNQPTGETSTDYAQMDSSTGRVSGVTPSFTEAGNIVGSSVELGTPVDVIGNSETL